MSGENCSLIEVVRELYGITTEKELDEMLDRIKRPDITVLGVWREDGRNQSAGFS